MPESKSVSRVFLYLPSIEGLMDILCGGHSYEKWWQVILERVCVSDSYISSLYYVACLIVVSQEKSEGVPRFCTSQIDSDSQSRDRARGTREKLFLTLKRALINFRKLNYCKSYFAMLFISHCTMFKRFNTIKHLLLSVYVLCVGHIVA